MSRPNQYGRIQATQILPDRVRVKLHAKLSDDPLFMVMENSPTTRTMHEGDFLRWNYTNVWWDPVTHEGKTYIDPILVKSLAPDMSDRLVFKKM